MGANQWAPLVLNIIFGGLAIFVFARFVGTETKSVAYLTVSAVAVALLTPLLPLVVGGMEHSLQVLVVLLFVHLAGRSLEDESGGWGGAFGLLLLVAPIVASVRYECALLGMVVCIAFLLRGRVVQAFFLGGVVLLPVIVFGFYSVAQGWHFFPNSVLLKGGVVGNDGGDGLSQWVGKSSYAKLLDNLHLLFLIFLALVLYLVRSGEAERKWRASQISLVVFVATSILHMQFAAAGWFYRYEAYLIALGLAACAGASAELIGRGRAALREDSSTLASTLAAATLLIFLTIPLVQRASLAHRVARMAMNDRYLEHVYPARFVEANYAGATMMANDIGAFNYLTSTRVLDVYGLGNLEPLEFRESEGGYTADRLKAWAEAEGVKIAVIQLGWDYIAERIPESWVKVGEWEVPRNVIFGDKKIGWFATSEAEVERLGVALMEFQDVLPSVVTQSGAYMGGVMSESDAPGDALAP